MYLQQVKNISASKALRRADLARLAGVSRAAVTRWFRQGQKTGRVNVETTTLRRLAEGLGVAPEVLLKRSVDLGPYQTRFLWDHLYPDMEHFVLALNRGELPAVARLVQVLGFRETTKVIGKKAVLWFERYKKYLKPVRRQQLEVVWPLYHSMR